MAAAKSARERLLDHLSGIAGYNDKGVHWYRHTPEEIRAHQVEAQEVILRLVAEIGAATFSPALLAALKSGAAAADDSGRFFEWAQRELTIDPVTPARQR